MTDKRASSTWDENKLKKKKRKKKTWNARVNTHETVKNDLLINTTRGDRRDSRSLWRER